MSIPVTVKSRGRMEYAVAFDEMRAFTAARNNDTPDQIWLLEHPPVYTLGTNADTSHLLNPDNTPLVETDRGGQVTWHGPGQLVAYVLLDIKRAQLGVRELVCKLEQAVIALLAEYNISAASREGAPGVYTNDAKIASIGLRIRRHCSYHGISINVCNDLRPFSRINPCGYEGLAVTRICDQGGPADLATVSADLLPHLLQQLQLTTGADVL